MKLKNDKYKKARGGCSRLLKISCQSCGTYLCNYQKDGPGLLKRMCLDRISNSNIETGGKQLICPSCQKVLGVSIIYEKENRPAIRLLIGSVNKKIVKSNNTNPPV